VTPTDTAERTHRWNWPNAITVGRLLLLIPFLVCLVRVHDGADWVRHSALVLLVILSASGVLDGYLARRLRQATASGRILDPLADKLLTLGSLFVLAIDPLSQPGFAVPNWVPTVALSKDLLTIGGVAWIKWKTGRNVARPRILGKACTALQLILIGLVLIAPDVDGAIPAMDGVVQAGCWIVTLCAAAAWVDYAVAGQRALGDGDNVHAD